MKRENVEQEAYLASYSDLEKNDVNLNIPRYVDSSVDETEDVTDLVKKMADGNRQMIIIRCFAHIMDYHRFQLIIVI